MKLPPLVPFILKTAIGVLLLLGGCVQVVSKLPTPNERQQAMQLEQFQIREHDNDTRIKIWKRCVEIHHRELEFAGRELPLELKQAKKICEEE